MRTRECRREPEVLDALLTGALPAELRAHAEACPFCREAAEIASLVRQDFEQAHRHARPPTADIVWLRAQIRAREEAAHTAASPIVFAQAMAAAALLGALVSVAGRLSLGTWIWGTVLPLPLELPLLPLGVALASWLVLAPVALYLALSRD